jgi:hypothetical protein
MAIEFSCPQCSRILRVSDEHAGKSARCPDCQTIMSIPAGQQHPDRWESPVPESPVPDSPVLPPVSGKPVERPAARAQARSAGFDEIFDYAWNAYRDHLGLLIGVTLVVVGFGLSIAMVQDSMMGRGIGPAAWLSSWLVGMVGNLGGLFLAIGQARINYDIARTGRAEFATLFSGFDRFLPLLGASIVAGMAMAAGLLLLVIPGLILAVLFWSFFHFIVDRRTGALDSFSAAWQIGKLNVGTTLVLLVVTVLLAIAGLLALLIGTLFTTPLISMLWCVAYLKMSGQL